ncbi:uncharacterized protein LOC102493602 [Tupaia chinensis]|uniref:uncharacterized protein LOC102493602 n=1 Tax=Tupaia chinensis TaxID=246437 RepID=UPI0003C8D57C|nr:uncharacterized protein LOC102493602 [Tupaia chinensis]
MDSYRSPGPPEKPAGKYKVSHKRNRVDLAAGVWAEFLGPGDCDPEDAPHHSNCLPGSMDWEVTLSALRPQSPASYFQGSRPSKTPGLITRTTSRAPTAPVAPAAPDVDMRPQGEAQLPTEAGGRASRPAGLPEDWRMVEEDRSPRPRAADTLLAAVDTRRPTLSRARATRPPRLGSERDRGPKLSLSKRKLELVLAEPERAKRKKQHTP